MPLPFFVTPLYAALCGLLLVALSLRVVRSRWKNRVSLGDGGHDDLTRAIRAQGNLTEYAPLALFLLFLLELSHQAPFWVLHLLGAGFFLGRLLHARSILTPARHPGRQAGMTLTFIVLIVTSIWLLIIVVGRLV